VWGGRSTYNPAMCGTRRSPNDSYSWSPYLRGRCPLEVRPLQRLQRDCVTPPVTRQQRRDAPPTSGLAHPSRADRIGPAVHTQLNCSLFEVHTQLTAWTGPAVHSQLITQGCLKFCSTHTTDSGLRPRPKDAFDVTYQTFSLTAFWQFMALLHSAGV
jgi:hypothetical protein